MLTRLRSMNYAVLTLIAGVLLFPIANVTGQIHVAGQGRVLERQALPFEPIEITDVRIKGQSVGLNKALTDDIDWLQGLTFRVKNISGKPISYISIELRVNPPESGNLPKVTQISAGPSPYSSDGTPQPARTLVAPDDFAEVTFNEIAYDVYKYELQASKVHVQVGMVFFTDDSAWSRGVLLKRDPKNINRWIVIKESERKLEEFLKKQSSQRLSNNSLQSPVASFQPVVYRTGTGTPSPKLQWQCYVFWGIDLIPCDYCVDAYKTLTYLGGESGVHRLIEVSANCNTNCGCYCYPYETTYSSEYCF